jgi:hypothetical protein
VFGCGRQLLAIAAYWVIGERRLRAVLEGRAAHRQTPSRAA